MGLYVASAFWLGLVVLLLLDEWVDISITRGGGGGVGAGNRNMNETKIGLAEAAIGFRSNTY